MLGSLAKGIEIIIVTSVHHSRKCCSYWTSAPYPSSFHVPSTNNPRQQRGHLMLRDAMLRDASCTSSPTNNYNQKWEEEIHPVPKNCLAKSVRYPSAVFPHLVSHPRRPITVKGPSNEYWCRCYDSRMPTASRDWENRIDRKFPTAANSLDFIRWACIFLLKARSS